MSHPGWGPGGCNRDSDLFCLLRGMGWAKTDLGFLNPQPESHCGRLLPEPCAVARLEGDLEIGDARSRGSQGTTARLLERGKKWVWEPASWGST